MPHDPVESSADDLRGVLADLVAREGAEWAVRARAFLDAMTRDADADVRRAGTYWLAAFGGVLELIDDDGHLEDEERRIRELLELAGLGAEAWCLHADRILREAGDMSAPQLAGRGVTPTNAEVEELRRLGVAMRGAAKARRGSLAKLFEESRVALELLTRTPKGLRK